MAARLRAARCARLGPPGCGAPGHAWQRQDKDQVVAGASIERCTPCRMLLAPIAAAHAAPCLRARRRQGRAGGNLAAGVAAHALHQVRSTRPLQLPASCEPVRVANEPAAAGFACCGSPLLWRQSAAAGLACRCFKKSSLVACLPSLPQVRAPAQAAAGGGGGRAARQRAGGPHQGDSVHAGKLRNLSGLQC